jgi:hypothetical protein
MKWVLRFTALCVVAFLVCACSTASIKSDGQFKGGAPLVRLAAWANPDIRPMQWQGDVMLGLATNPGMRRYAAVFARDFNAQFPQVLAANGIAVADRDASDAALLRLEVTGGEMWYQLGVPHVRVDITGVLRDAEGAPVWTFSTRVKPEEMDQQAFQQFLDSLIVLMTKDQVIAPPAAR